MWKKFFFEWANLGPKMPKNRVFWTFCKICSLVFLDFLYKDVELKCTNSEKNFFFKVLVFFGANLGPKMPKNRVFWTLWKFCPLVFPDFLHKDVELKFSNCEKKISKKKLFGPIWAQKCPKIGFFWTFFMKNLFFSFLYFLYFLCCNVC